MTQEQPGYTYSSRMELSLTEWADTSKLGRAIVSQLGLDEHDTLSRWMAYRLAELLNQGESDDSKKEAATNLVLRIWRRRSDWPNGWPPAAVARELAWLFPPERHHSQQSLHSQDRLMRTVTHELTTEYRFWLRLASDHGIDLTPEEITLLTVEPTATRDFMQRIMELKDQHKTKLTADKAQEKLDTILQTRRSLLQTVLTSDDSLNPDYLTDPPHRN